MNFIRALAAGLPAGFHVAVGSRLRLGFGRLRSEDRSVEFGAEDLAFTEEEARAVLAHAGVDSSEDTVERTGPAHRGMAGRGLPRRAGHADRAGCRRWRRAG